MRPRLFAALAAALFCGGCVAYYPEPYSVSRPYIYSPSYGPYSYVRPYGPASGYYLAPGWSWYAPGWSFGFGYRYYQGTYGPRYYGPRTYGPRYYGPRYYSPRSYTPRTYGPRYYGRPH